ncbi:MAG: nucleotide exchange factor GrpE [Saprospiraceae bacterium]
MQSSQPDQEIPEVDQENITTDEATSDTSGEAAATETVEAEEVSELDTVRTELTELKDKYLRLMAEFDNFRKRTARQRNEERATAAIGTMNSILPVVDDFDRAKANALKEDTEETFSNGVELVYAKLKRTLEGLGLKQMVSTGEVFDAELHEAFTEIPAPTPEMVGKVVDTIEQGYKLNDKLIRHAKVVVGK